MYLILKNNIPFFTILISWSLFFMVSCSDAGPPEVVTFTPDFGPVSTLITVEGNNFDELISLDFNDGVTADYNPSFGTNTALLFRVPVDAPLGDNMITMTTPSGTTSFPFRVTLEAPSIFNFSPQSANEGAIVSITGKNFFEPLEVLFFDSIPGNIIFASEDSIAVEVPANVQRGRLIVNANGGAATTPEFFFSTNELLVNDFDGNGIRAETVRWLFYGNIDQSATTAIYDANPEATSGNFLKLTGTDTGGIWIGGTESHSNAQGDDFDVFEINSDINNTYVEFDINSNGRTDTHVIIVLAERDGSINDFTQTIPVDWEGWKTVSIPFNRFADLEGALPNPQKIRTIKFHLFNEASSNLPLEINLDNIKFIETL